MALIRKSTELTIPSTVKMMIYGQAGMGKTVAALSAPKPLLLDFDGGVKRVNLSLLDGVDIVQVQDWNDIKQLFQSPQDLATYQSIVVDTIGKMIDFIITYKCGTRQPRVQDWSGINQEFTWFTRQLSNLGKHIVFVAHRDTRKEGDTTVYIPSLREKNYNAIVTELDLLGYLEMVSDRGVQTRTITFDPTNRNDGKNTCSLPAVMNIPTIIDANGNAIGANDFILKKVIEPYAAMLEKKQEQQRQYSHVIAEINQGIMNILDADDANEFVKKIDSYAHVGSSKDKARAEFSRRVKELGLLYESKTKSYKNAEAEAEK